MRIKAGHEPPDVLLTRVTKDIQSELMMTEQRLRKGDGESTSSEYRLSLRALERLSKQLGSLLPGMDSPTLSSSLTHITKQKSMVFVAKPVAESLLRSSGMAASNPRLIHEGSCTHAPVLRRSARSLSPPASGAVPTRREALGGGQTGTTMARIPPRYGYLQGGSSHRAEPSNLVPQGRIPPIAGMSQGRLFQQLTLTTPRQRSSRIARDSPRSPASLKARTLPLKALHPALRAPNVSRSVEA